MNQTRIRSTVPAIFDSNHSRNVLIVGDPALGRGLLSLMLTRLDYDVVFAASGRAALAQISQAYPSLALIALELGDMPGLSLARRLARQAAAGQRLPTVLFGDALDERALRNACRETGIDGYFTKPIAFVRLVELIRELTSDAARTCLPC